MKGRNGRYAGVLLVVAWVLGALWPADARAQGAGWQWQNPLPPDQDLHGVWGGASTDLFVVGRAGTIVHDSCVYSSYLRLVLKTR